MNRKLAPFQKSDDSLNFRRTQSGGLGIRTYFLPIGVCVVLLLLSTRLFQLTVVKGSYYRYLAENNRIRQILVPAERGDIIDRKGFPLATSKKVGDEIWRSYSEGPAAAHTVGFIQTASAEDVRDDACTFKLGPNDFVGKTGLEKIFECDLRGKKGKKLVEVDSHEKPLKVLNFVPPEKGKQITTSLDAYLQKTAYDALQKQISNSGGVVELSEKKAAVVALMPQTGEVFILLSTPSFDPEVFERRDSQQIKTVLTDERKLLFDRATQGVYPPGSVIKPVLAAGALQDGIIDTSFTINDEGTIKAGKQVFGNWYFLEYGKTEGVVDVVKALRRSNDIFFYKLGEEMGDSKIKQWAQKFGLGEKTGIALPESIGQIPSAFWKQEVIGERWYLGDTYNTAIGQGYIEVTPLQIAVETAAFANGGKVCVPKLLKDAPPNCHSIGLSKDVLDIVQQGMHEACSAGGTGWPFFDFRVKNSSTGGPTATDTAHLTKKIEVGCKTGTAESHLPSGIPHAWFTIFAPFENPEIVLTVMVEESGQGSNVAAPVAKDILKAYFERVE